MLVGNLGGLAGTFWGSPYSANQIEQRKFQEFYAALQQSQYPIASDWTITYPAFCPHGSDCPQCRVEETKRKIQIANELQEKEEKQKAYKERCAKYMAEFRKKLKKLEG